MEKVREMTTEFNERLLRRMILADNYNRLVFRAAGKQPLYLVGGYLRDLLIGRVSPDRDYLAGDDYEALLRKIAYETGGKLIRLGGYLGRIVLSDKTTLDFSPILEDIEADLSRRDFTVNSLAWSPGTGTLDPNDGIEDLCRKNIRMISRVNIEDDPIRILRAYRLAGQLCYSIDRSTRKTIEELSPRLIEVKSERITLELFKILNLETPEKIFDLLMRDGPAQYLFPIASEELRAKVRVFSRVKRIFNALPLKFKEILCNKCPQNLSCLGMLRLELLLAGVSAHALSLSSLIIRKIRLIEEADKLLPEGKWSQGDIFDAFSLMGDASIDFLTLKNATALLSEYDRYRRIKKDGLLPAEDIMNVSGLRGSQLGGAIRMLRKAEFNRQINSREEALMLLQGH